MSFVYTWGGSRYEAKVDPERCKAAVHDIGRGCGIHQCRRKIGRDGWCKQHHPEAEAARRQAASDRWDADIKAREDARRCKECPALRADLATVTRQRDGLVESVAAFRAGDLQRGVDLSEAAIDAARGES